MTKRKIRFGKQSGGQLSLVIPEVIVSDEKVLATEIVEAIKVEV